MVWYTRFNVPLDTVQVISLTGAYLCMHIKVRLEAVLQHFQHK